MARPVAPDASSTSTSTVGLPRESRTSRPAMCSMLVMVARTLWLVCCSCCWCGHVTAGGDDRESTRCVEALALSVRAISEQVVGSGAVMHDRFAARRARLRRHLRRRAAAHRRPHSSRRRPPPGHRGRARRRRRRCRAAPHLGHRPAARRTAAAHRRPAGRPGHPPRAGRCRRGSVYRRRVLRRRVAWCPNRRAWTTSTGARGPSSCACSRHHAGAAGRLPHHWIDLAGEWVFGDQRPEAAVRLRVLGVELTVPAKEAAGDPARMRHRRAPGATSSPATSARASAPPRSASAPRRTWRSAAGGPRCDDDGLARPIRAARRGGPGVQRRLRLRLPRLRGDLRRARDGAVRTAWRSRAGHRPTPSPAGCATATSRRCSLPAARHRPRRACSTPTCPAWRRVSARSLGARRRCARRLAARRADGDGDVRGRRLGRCSAPLLLRGEELADELLERAGTARADARRRRPDEAVGHGLARARRHRDRAQRAPPPGHPPDRARAGRLARRRTPHRRPDQRCRRCCGTSSASSASASTTRYRQQLEAVAARSSPPATATTPPSRPAAGCSPTGSCGSTRRPWLRAAGLTESADRLATLGVDRRRHRTSCAPSTCSATPSSPPAVGSRSPTAIAGDGADVVDQIAWDAWEDVAERTGWVAATDAVAPRHPGRPRLRRRPAGRRVQPRPAHQRPSSRRRPAGWATRSGRRRCTRSLPRPGAARGTPGRGASSTTNPRSRSARRCADRSRTWSPTPTTSPSRCCSTRSTPTPATPSPADPRRRRRERLLDQGPSPPAAGVEGGEAWRRALDETRAVLGRDPVRRRHRGRPHRAPPVARPGPAAGRPGRGRLGRPRGLRRRRAGGRGTGRRRSAWPATRLRGARPRPQPARRSSRWSTPLADALASTTALGARGRSAAEPLGGPRLDRPHGAVGRGPQRGFGVDAVGPGVGDEPEQQRRRARRRGRPASGRGRADALGLGQDLVGVEQDGQRRRDAVHDRRPTLLRPLDLPPSSDDLIGAVERRRRRRRGGGGGGACRGCPGPRRRG